MTEFVWSRKACGERVQVKIDLVDTKDGANYLRAAAVLPASWFASAHSKETQENMCALSRAMFRAMDDAARALKYPHPRQEPYLNTEFITNFVIHPRVDGTCVAVATSFPTTVEFADQISMDWFRHAMCSAYDEHKANPTPSDK